MGLIGFISSIIRRLVKYSIYFVIVAAIIVLIPNLPPYTKFSSIKVVPTQARVGALAPNNLLNNAVPLYVDKVYGPEAFQVYNGELYTSFGTGEIVKISPGGHITFVTKIGLPCTGLSQERKCGRPLGFQIDESKNVLYVVDAYYGIWKVDLKTDKKQLLVSPRKEIEGKTPKLFNNIALDKNGDFYWTDSTSDYNLQDGAYSLMSDPSGRLFHYNAAKNESKVLLDNLWFPNGVVLSPDHQFVVVAETFQSRLLKYYVSGPKKGKSEVFVDGLPGSPDNLRVLPDGSGLLACLYNSYDEEDPMVAKHMAQTPLVRKFLARIQRLIEIPFEFLNAHYPHVVLDDIVYNIGHFKSLGGLVPKKAGLVQIDWDGKVVASYFNNDGSLGHISDAIVFNGKLLTGSPHSQNFIGAVAIPRLLQKAFASQSAPKTETKPKPVETPKKVEQPKKEAPKVVKPAATEPNKPVQAKPTEAPKPTTPKPTEKPTTTTPPPKATKPSPQKVTSPPPKQSEEKVTTPKPTTKQPEVKSVPKQPEVKTVPKQPEVTPAEAKTSKPEAAEKSKPVKDSTKESKAKPSGATPTKPVPEQIPITENIPSDTRKPDKETLKVIKKDGPVEIPNPHL